MKARILVNMILTALLLCGCSEQDNNLKGANQETKTTPVIISASRETTPVSKTEYEDNDPNGLIVKWKGDKSDKIGVFATNGTTSNAEFGVVGELLKEGKIANFTGDMEVADPNSAITVYAYYPYLSSESNKNALTIDLADQYQNGTGATNHLEALDFMVSTPFTYNRAIDMQGANIPLVFNPVLTIMSFEITNPSESTIEVNSIRLEAVGNETPFYTCGKIDITDKTYPITHEGYTATNGVELLTTTGTIQGGDKGRFSMMIFPLTDQVPTQCKVIVRTDIGNYTQTKSTPLGGFVRGKRYIMEVDNMTEPVAASGITLNKKTTSISLGAAEKLYARVTPENATNKNVIWSSDDMAVATVSASGEVLAMDIGTANITATTEDGGFKSSCQVTVINSTGRTLIRNSTALKTALQNGGKYILASNISTSEFTGFYHVSNDVDLDLNSHILEGNTSAGFITISESKTLIICDNSSLKAGVIRNNIIANSSEDYPCCAIILSNNSELKLLSGSIVALSSNAIQSILKYPYSYDASFIMDEGNVSGRVNIRHGTILIHNGEVKGVTLGSSNSYGVDAKLTLNGGKIVNGIECLEKTNVTINGGEIIRESTTYAEAVKIRGNCDFTLNGGTITAIGEYVNAIDVSESYAGYNERITVNINGGNIVAKGISSKSTVGAIKIITTNMHPVYGPNICDFVMTGGSVNADHPSGIGFYSYQSPPDAIVNSTIKAGTIKGGDVAVSGIFPQIASGSSILNGGFLEKTVVIGPSN